MQRSKLHWMMIIILSVGGVIGQGGWSNATELPVDVAIVTLVSGDVTYQANQQKPVSVIAFMKLRQDDLVTLPEGAQLKLLYTKSGRQELWQGPVMLQLSETESLIQGERAAQSQPQVENLSKADKNKIVGVVLSFDGGRIQKTGGTTVRDSRTQPQESVPAPTPLELTEDELREIEEAKARYAEMRKQAAANDFTPELYLLGIYDYYELYAEMQTLTAKLLRQQPDNPFLKAWAEWAQAQTK